MRRVHYAMSTFLSIEAFGEDEKKLAVAVESAFAEARRIEGVLSPYREDSEVFTLNRRAHLAPQHVSDELFALIKESVMFSDISKGAFDITLGALLDLWKQAEKSGVMPSLEARRFAAAQCGFRHLGLDEAKKTVRFERPLRLNFGAVGKGYALDAAVALLKEKGVRRARLDFGGQLFYFDASVAEEEYVGLRHPLSPEEMILQMPLKNASLATSADYERGLVIEGKRFSHILDARDAGPAKGAVVSASVAAPSAMLADMFSTAVFLLGFEEGMGLAKKFAGTRIVVVEKTHETLRVCASWKDEARCLRLAAAGA